MKTLHIVAYVLLIIGGLDWLLYAFNLEVFQYLGSAVATVVYILVGLAALLELFTHKKNCRVCGGQATI